MKRIVLLCVAVTFLIGVYAEGMIEVFSWRQIDYYNRGDQFVGPAPGPGGDSGSRKQRPGPIVFPSNRRAKRANDEWRNSRDPRPDVDLSLRFAGQPGNSSTYIPYNNVPMGATHHKGRLFVTMPRRRVGIPSTLNYIDMKADGNKPSPKLRAYPNFETNYLSPDLGVDPSRLLSVYRTTVDECERLWFIDTGILEYPGNQQQLQKPSIWVVDLKTDRVLHRYEMPTETVERGNGLASISVDVMGGNCSNTYAYVPDLMNYRLYVFSLAEMDIWTFSHNYFNFDPLAGDLRIGGQSFRWNDGIFSTTLGPRDRRGYRNMYFHAMASNNEFYVNTEVLQNRANTGSVGDSNDFQILGSRGQARQSTMHEYDPRTGVIFYNEIQRNGIGCWNTNKPFSADNHGTVIEDAERMIYPSDLTIDTDGNMWVMSNSMPIFIYSELDPSIVNFRVWKQNVNMAARNTVCQMRRR